ncbi:hypothetical protein BC343_06390 [Mucilaginibacter pedocola]|uniref:histidine kinase n=2 Tax=Mucilaginibacter pedocola TaxID=1792845 RepID=A0A1S9PFV2_9SPHI|nr:hypothetical protein BC343_06390 [Mucilaginibacter pedocola]
MLATMPANAQRIDSAYFKALLREVRIARVDTEKIAALNKVAQYYNNKFYIDSNKTNLHKALETLGQCIQLAETAKNNEYKFESIKVSAYTYLALNDTVNAVTAINKVLAYRQGQKAFEKQLATYLYFARAAYRWSHNAISINFARKGLNAAKTYKISTYDVPLKMTIVLATVDMGDDETALRENANIIAYYKNKHQNLARAYFNAAGPSRYKGDLKTALKYALLSLKDIEAFHDTVESHNTYGELALIYQALGSTEQSIFYFRKTLAARDRMLMQDRFRFRTLGFIIKGLIKLGRAKEGLAETIAYEAHHPPTTREGKGFCAQNKAYCYEALNDYTNAEKFYKQAVELVIGINNDEIEGSAYYDISAFYIKNGMAIKAQQYASKLRKTSLDTYKNYEHLQFQIDSALGNYRSALIHYGNSQRAKDSLFNESKSKEIAELQLKYETAQKEADIKMLKKNAQLQKNQLKQSEHIRNLTFGGVVLLIAAIALLYNSYRISIGKTREINEKNLSLSALLEEKEWLMKEVHHRVKNNLQIVMGLLQRQSSYISNTAALKAIRNSEHRIHAIALIHQKLYQSEGLALINMREYIEELLLHLKDTTDADSHIVFIKEIDNIYLHVAQAVPLGLIINEAVTNAIKYAYPNGGQGNIRVTFSNKAEGKNELVIEDEGVGISGTVANKSMGMSLMRGLTKQLSGTFNFTHTEGVSIHIVFKNDHSEPQGA